MVKKRKVAIFDIDGTIFRSSLIIEFLDALIQEGIFPKTAIRVYNRAHKKWLDRQGSYEDYIESVVRAFIKHIKGKDYKRFTVIARRVADFHKNRVYQYTRDLVRELKKKNYYLLAISNSPKMVLDEFCRKLGFDKVYGRIYETDRVGKFTGKVNHLELVSDKAAILKRAVAKESLTLAGSVGVGDTESDIPFLKLVERPVCFNPNMKLYRYARRRGWTIVVERKDVVYNINN